jgi:hypothetical protein
MRSTKDLLAEFNEEGTKHWVTLMVVSFEESSIMIHPNSKQQEVNEAIQMGGQPIGLIAVDEAQNQLTIRTKTFPENADMEEECGELLQRLSVQVATSLREHGKAGA